MVRVSLHVLVVKISSEAPGKGQPPNAAARHTSSISHVKPGVMSLLCVLKPKELGRCGQDYCMFWASAIIYMTKSDHEISISNLKSANQIPYTWQGLATQPRISRWKNTEISPRNFEH